MSTTSDKRVRKLTPKAMEGYIERVEKFEKQTKKQCAVVFEVINGKSPELLDKLEKKTMKANLVAEYKRYDSVITEFVRYLNFINTQESQERVEELQVQMTHDRAVANDFLANITSSESDSKSNKSSLRSSNSTARIQAAKAKAAFAAQEAELERKQVELNETEKVRSAAAERKKLNLEIDLKLLKEQKELAIVEAELCESEDGVDLGLPAVDPKLRTADYVNYGCSDYIQILKDHDTPLKPTLNNNTATSDFAKYFLKKDLLISRLVVFSDTPESFHGWKSTFSSVISEIGASAAEELDLLIKWLGISSRKQIISLKSAYVHNPQIGLAKAWERLDERFGSPETIFHSTNKKLSAFPKILNKEGAAKLYDLSDILAEAEGAVRRGGYWIIGGKRAVSTLIFNCVPCKKLRGRFENQKMSDLPVDRVEQSIPFTYVGVDVFGPWQVVTRRTRASQASAKRWAVLFTCLSIRAVHIEVVDEMSSSAFINALRRFISIRGQVKHFRSDRGTNFVGATDHINVDVINVEDETTKSFLRKSGSVWVFNTPHSSHMGGAWERMIGVTRRILDSMLSKVLVNSTFIMDIYEHLY